MEKSIQTNFKIGKKWEKRRLIEIELRNSENMICFVSFVNELTWVKNELKLDQTDSLK